MDSWLEPKMTVPMAKLVAMDLTSVNRFKIHFMLALAAECSWGGRKSQGQTLGVDLA